MRVAPTVSKQFSSYWISRHVHARSATEAAPARGRELYVYFRRPARQDAVHPAGDRIRFQQDHRQAQRPRGQKRRDRRMTSGSYDQGNAMAQERAAGRGHGPHEICRPA